MTDLLAALTAGTTLLTLLAGFVGHLARPGTLQDALRRHGLLPSRVVHPAAVAVPAAEGVLGLGGLAALFAGGRDGLVAVLIAAAVLFGAYAGYTRYALATGRGGPCGCAGAELPLSAWITGRATVLALCATTGAALTGFAGAVPPTGADRIGVTVLATLTFGLLLWILPAAMHDPAAPSRTTARPTTAGVTGGML